MLSQYLRETNRNVPRIKWMMQVCTVASGNTGMDLLVLHHTDCGILRLAEEPDALAGFLGTDLAHLDAMTVKDPYRSVVHDVSVLRGLAMPGLRVWGLVYDVSSGAVDITASPREAAA